MRSRAAASSAAGAAISAAMEEKRRRRDLVRFSWSMMAISSVSIARYFTPSLPQKPAVLLVLCSVLFLKNLLVFALVKLRGRRLGPVTKLFFGIHLASSLLLLFVFGFTLFFTRYS